MLGLGSYTFRWSIGHKGLVPDRPMSHADVLDVAHDQGLELVQFADNIPLDTVSDGVIADLNAKAQELGITIELGTQAFKADEIKHYLGYATALNAGILRVALDGPDAEIPVPDLAMSFRQLLPLAKDVGVRFAVENHFSYPSKQLAQLMAEIDDPSVGVCLDVANSICAGEWPMETVATLAPFAINLHLKDYDIVPDPYGVGFAIYGTPLGQGRSDCRVVLDALPRDRDINVILEHWLPKSEDMEKARSQEHSWLTQSVSYARQTLGL